MTTFLQISAFQQPSDWHENCAAFKCLGCKEIFTLSDKTIWKFCPNCGAEIKIEYKTIKRKQFFDNFGYSVLIDGKWQHLKSPVFTLIIEFNSFTDKEWVAYDCFPQTGDHLRLKHWIKSYEAKILGKEQKNGRNRAKIVPSEPLPLP